jgi:membrane-associated phospholipid phosphatase
VTNRATALLGAAAIVLALVLGVPFAGERFPSAVDTAVAGPLGVLNHTLLNVLALPTEPYVLFPAIALIALYCLYARRFADAPAAVLGPAIAVAVNTWLLKPTFDRWKGTTLVYPSGHTVSLAATLTVLVLLIRRVFAIVAAALILAAAAIGLIGLGYHYFTDVCGGALFGAGVVLLMWSALRRGPRRSSGLPRASTSSGSHH